MRISLLLLCVLFLCGLCLPAPANAQRRDYMTDEEIEIVRDAQDIDLRIDVLIKMIDRRFAALGIEVGGWKQAGKESDVWGPLPKGTRPELFSDIKRLLQKAIDDIDNIAARPDAAPIRDLKDRNDARAAKDDPNRFPRSVKNLAKAAERFGPALKTALDSTKDEKDKGPILDSIDSCVQILAAVGKLPAEIKPDPKPGTKKDPKKSKH